MEHGPLGYPFLGTLNVQPTMQAGFCSTSTCTHFLEGVSWILVPKAKAKHIMLCCRYGSEKGLHPSAAMERERWGKNKAGHYNNNNLQRLSPPAPPTVPGGPLPWAHDPAQPQTPISPYTSTSPYTPISPYIPILPYTLITPYIPISPYTPISPYIPISPIYPYNPMDTPWPSYTLGTAIPGTPGDAPQSPSLHPRGHAMDPGPAAPGDTPWTLAQWHQGTRQGPWPSGTRGHARPLSHHPQGHTQSPLSPGTHAGDPHSPNPPRAMAHCSPATPKQAQTCHIPPQARTCHHRLGTHNGGHGPDNKHNGSQNPHPPKTTGVTAQPP